MSPPPPDIFPLARRRLRRRGAIRLVFGLLLVAVALVDLLDLTPMLGGESPLRLWFLALLGGLYLVTQGVLRVAAAAGAEIRLGAEQVYFPPGIATFRGRAVDYGDIELLLAQRRRGQGRVIVGTRARVHVVDALDIGGISTLKRFHDQLRAHIAASGAGTAHLERVDKGLAVTRRLMGRRARATELILLVLIAAYIAEIALDAIGPFSLMGGEPLALIRLGAIVPWLVIGEGEWFRLVTGTVLHAGLVHIYVNGMALLALGGLLERLIGGYRLAIVYIFSALVGSLCSAFVSGGWLSVGASGAVFGLLGAFGVLQLRHGARLPPGIAQSRRWWLFILGINLGLPVVLPMIDVWAHVGGFVGGALAAGILLATPAAIRPDRSPPFAVQAVGMALVGLAAAGLALGVDYTRSADRWMAAELRSAIEQPGVEPDVLNLMAWTLVTDPEAPAHMLELAHDAAEEAIARAPDDVRIWDTRATALYRLGRHAEAIAEERRVLAAEPVDYYATQLLRFVEAGRAARRPPLDGPLIGPGLALDRPGEPLAGRPEIEGDSMTFRSLSERLRPADGAGGPPDDVVLFAALRIGGVARGVIRTRFAWDDTNEYRASRGEGPEPPSGGTIVPLLLDRPLTGDTKETKGWRFWGAVEAVTDLP